MTLQKFAYHINRRTNGDSALLKIFNDVVIIQSGVVGQIARLKVCGFSLFFAVKTYKIPKSAFLAPTGRRAPQGERVAITTI